MVLDKGDRWAVDGAFDVTLTTDGTGVQGDLVKFTASKKVAQCGTSDTAYVGVLAEDAGADGDKVGVRFHGPVMVVADGTISAGDLLVCSSSTAGQVEAAAAAEGIVTAVDEGSTGTYNVYSRPLIAMEDAVDGDVFEAFLG